MTNLFIWVLDLNGTILACNDAVTRRLGYTSHELTGKQLFSPDILPDSHKEGQLLNLKTLESLHKVETRIKTRDGTGFRIHLMAERIYITENIYFIVSATDITPLQFDLHSIGGTDAGLHDLAKGRNQIFSVIAHDLRSPFNTILGYCELLSRSIKKKDIEKSLGYTEIIHDAAGKTLSFLVKLLDWGRTQRGPINFNPEFFTIEKLVTDILRFVKFQAESKKILIGTNIEPGLCVYGDINMIRTVIINLVTNSIKFCKSGGKIIITAHAVPCGVEFVIADNGIGMVAEHLDRIFCGDQSVTTFGTGMEQGAGLGLSLCKNFIDLHRGRIWAESEPRIGSKFKFILPSVNLA